MVRGVNPWVTGDSCVSPFYCSPAAVTSYLRRGACLCIYACISTCVSVSRDLCYASNNYVSDQVTS